MVDAAKIKCKPPEIQESHALRERITFLEQELRLEKLKVEQLLKRLFGSSSEKQSASPLSDKFLAGFGPEPSPAASTVALSEDEPEEERKKRKPASPRQVHTQVLKTEVVRLEPAEKLCPHCGKEKCCLEEVKTTELDFVPAHFIRREFIRPKLACPCGEGSVAIAPLPPRLVEKGCPGPGLLAHVALSKYGDHLPLYRQAEQYERLGMPLSRQTLCNWMEHAAFWLQPIYNLLKTELLSGNYLQVDETPVKVMDPDVQGKTATGYLWVFAKPGGHVIFEFNPSRGMGLVLDRLKDFKGVVQCDGYVVYDALITRLPQIERAGCWAHVRRKFYEAREDNPEMAAWFIQRIGRLYRLEALAREKNFLPEERRLVREAEARPIIDEIDQKLKELQGKLLPKSPLGKAVGYALNEWTSLQVYLAKGELEIDNNLIENSIRPTAVGKKNWLFIGHPKAAWRSAVIYTILGNCQRYGINPWEYLKDVFTRLPGMKAHEVADLVPSRWKKPADPAPANQVG